MARVSETGVKDIFSFIDASDNLRLGAYLTSRPQAASARNLQNISAILYALYRRNHDAVKMLRDRLLSLDLWEAAALGEEKILRSLIQPGDDPDALSPDGYTALQLASFFGREAAVALLLELGADPNAVSANAGRTRALHGAAAGRHLEVARLLIAAGAEIDARQASGHTALDAAIKNRDDDMARLLAPK
jgi:ankyrin repeat protein